MTGDVAIFAGLFVTSLIAGTLLPFLPGSSELALGGLLSADVAEPAALIGTAVAANVLGATGNYFIGRHVSGLSERRWFPIPAQTLERASDWFRRYGVWTLAFCWLPTVGDAMTLVAGLLRADFRLFFILVFLGKLFGHLAVASGFSLLLN